MQIRHPEERDKDAVRALWVECFTDGGPAFVDWYFDEVYRGDRTLCLFEGGALASALQMIPYALRLRGRAVPAHTLTGVSTGAAHRKRGLARALMAEALSLMTGRGIGFTFLYPFSHVFYQRLGWETCSASLEYLKPAVELPDAMPAGWAVLPPDEPDAGMLSDLYNRFMAGFNCGALRDGPAWAKRLGEYRSLGGELLLAYRHGEPAGYALLEELEGEVSVGELVHTRADAVDALLAALRPRGKAVAWTAPAAAGAHLLPGHWKDRVKFQPHVMFRVVDVPLAFAQAAPARDGEIVLEVTGDNMRGENNGRYRVVAANGVARAEHTHDEAQFACGVGTLARVLTGYADAAEAVGAGLAAGAAEAVERLTAMYPRESNFLFELY